MCFWRVLGFTNPKKQKYHMFMCIFGFRAPQTIIFIRFWEAWDEKHWFCIDFVRLLMKRVGFALTLQGFLWKGSVLHWFCMVFDAFLNRIWSRMRTGARSEAGKDFALLLNNNWTRNEHWRKTGARRGFCIVFE